MSDETVISIKLPFEDLATKCDYVACRDKELPAFYKDCWVAICGLLLHLDEKEYLKLGIGDNVSADQINLWYDKPVTFNIDITGSAYTTKYVLEKGNFTFFINNASSKIFDVLYNRLSGTYFSKHDSDTLKVDVKPVQCPLGFILEAMDVKLNPTASYTVVKSPELGENITLWLPFGAKIDGADRGKDYILNFPSVGDGLIGRKTTNVGRIVYTYDSNDKRVSKIIESHVEGRCAECFLTVKIDRARSNVITLEEAERRGHDRQFMATMGYYLFKKLYIRLWDKDLKSLGITKLNPLVSIENQIRKSTIVRFIEEEDIVSVGKVSSEVYQKGYFQILVNPSTEDGREFITKHIQGTYVRDNEDDPRLDVDVEAMYHNHNIIFTALDTSKIPNLNQTLKLKDLVGEADLIVPKGQYSVIYNSKTEYTIRVHSSLDACRGLRETKLGNITFIHTSAVSEIMNVLQQKVARASMKKAIKVGNLVKFRASRSEAVWVVEEDHDNTVKIRTFGSTITRSVYKSKLELLPEFEGLTPDDFDPTSKKYKKNKEKWDKEEEIRKRKGSCDISISAKDIKMDHLYVTAHLIQSRESPDGDGLHILSVWPASKDDVSRIYTHPSIEKDIGISLPDSMLSFFKDKSKYVTIDLTKENAPKDVDLSLKVENVEFKLQLGTAVKTQMFLTKLIKLTDFS